MVVPPAAAVALGGLKQDSRPAVPDAAMPAAPGSTGHCTGCAASHASAAADALGPPPAAKGGTPWQANQAYGAQPLAHGMTDDVDDDEKEAEEAVDAEPAATAGVSEHVVTGSGAEPEADAEAEPAALEA